MSQEEVKRLAVIGRVSTGAMAETSQRFQNSKFRLTYFKMRSQFSFATF